MDGCFINRLFEAIEQDNDRVFISSDNRSSAIFIIIILLCFTGYYHILDIIILDIIFIAVVSGHIIN
jgi:hypothetical protein